MKLEEKKQITEELHERFARSKIVILTDYKGLNVTDLNALRRKLREAGIEYRVAKNSLLARASENTEVVLMKDQFKGPSAVAMSFEDPVAPAKVLVDFAKENKKFEVKFGVLNGKVLDAKAIEALSALPSREVLLSKLLSVFNAVPTSFVRVISGVPRNFLNVLNAIKEQKEAA